METFYESKYVTIEFDQERKTLFTRWTTQEYMSNEAYRGEMEKYMESVVKYQPTGVLVHSTEAKYVVPVETQDWMTTKLASLYEEHNTQKVSVIMSTDFIAQLSFEQVVEDVESEGVQLLFFDDEQKGIDWLLSNENSDEKAA